MFEWMSWWRRRIWWSIREFLFLLLCSFHSFFFFFLYSFWIPLATRFSSLIQVLISFLIAHYRLREMEESAFVDERMVAEDRSEDPTIIGTTTANATTKMITDTDTENLVNGHNHETESVDEDVVMV